MSMTTMDTKSKKEVAKAPGTKEKLRSIMEAASALTALGDEESDNGAPVSNRAVGNAKDDDDKDETQANGKRYLPEHKKPDAAPTFPEKLMNLMKFAEKQKVGFCVAWLEDGKSFVIRNPDEFTRDVVPRYFKPTKFSSFTRKLYRWGFRQINRGIGPDDPIIFGNEFFQRDDEHLMAKMRSITAAGTRKVDQGRQQVLMCGMKRQVPEFYDDSNQKRMLLDQLLHQHKANYMQPQGNSYYGGMSANGTMPLTSAIRTSMGLGNPTGHNMIAYNNHNSMMPAHHAHQGNNLMNQYVPSSMHNPQYPSTQSTADIVNAAIAALRYAN